MLPPNLRLRANPAALARPESSQQVARIMQYSRLVREACFPIFEERNRKYGESFVETGVHGAYLALHTKVSRLRTLVHRSTDHGRGERDEVLDNAIDTVNYGLILLMMLEEDNWDGIDDPDALEKETKERSDETKEA